MTARYAVFHNVTLELLGSIAGDVVSRSLAGPPEDGRAFRLRLRYGTRGCVRAMAIDEDVEPYETSLEFTPLLLKRGDVKRIRTTWVFFTDAGPSYLERLIGFWPIEREG